MLSYFHVSTHDDAFARRLETAKRASTSHLLIKCARLVNERAVASLPGPMGQDAVGERPRTSHLALMPHIELDGGTRVTDLAAKIGITKQAVGQLVDDMERFGIVERMPDPDDGRAKRVCFTGRGRESMLQGLDHLRRVDKELTRVLGREPMAELRRALLTLHDHYQDDAEAQDEDPV